ncbi:MAG: hypothetical protein QXS38_00900 [Candidatus Pacearchaeota archaeon]
MTKMRNKICLARWGWLKFKKRYKEFIFPFGEEETAKVICIVHMIKRTKAGVLIQVRDIVDMRYLGILKEHPYYSAAVNLKVGTIIRVTAGWTKNSGFVRDIEVLEEAKA